MTRLLLITRWFLPFCMLIVEHRVCAQRYPINFDSLNIKIDSIAKKNHLIGAQVLVFTRDNVLFKRNVGFKNLASKQPVTDNTMFRLGSITKSVVAVSALQLIEQGKLSLNDQLKELAPEIKFENQWEQTDPIRIVHLLEHTTGWDDWALKEYAFNSDSITLQQGIELYPESRKSRWRPGTFFAYCNSGPPVVARIIEKKTGEEFESLVRRRIFDPLGMKGITFRLDGDAVKNIVTNYSGEENPKEEPYWAILRRPAGSLNSSALEFMPFVQMLMNRGYVNGQKIIDSTSVDRMELPQSTLAAQAGSNEGYGLHNYTTSFKGHLFHGHDGGVNGGLARYLYQSDLNIGFIVLVNYDGSGFGKLNDAVMKTIMEAVTSALPEKAVLTEQHKQWTGYYRSAYPRAQMTYFLEWPLNVIRVFEREGKLMGQPLLGGDLDEFRPMSGSRFAQIDKTGYTNGVTAVKNGDEEMLILAFGNMRKSGAFAAWLPIVVGGLALLFTVMGVLIGLIWFLRALYLRNNGRLLSALAARLNFWGYSISFVVVVVLVITNFSGFGLGKPNLSSYLVFVLSLAMAAFAVLAVYFWMRDKSRMTSRPDRLLLFFCVASALCITLYCAIFGLVGIRTWA